MAEETTNPNREQPQEKPIPEPSGYPIIGNLGILDPKFPLGSLLHLADLYGEAYKLTFVNKELIFATTNELINELCGETKYKKVIAQGLLEIRNGVHDGLFTAHGPEEPNWGIAHRVLMPAFGPVSIRGMFPEMLDIANQLVMKWARHGTEAPINASEDFTRLALDTLALCSMDFRFNSYYKEEMHPFVEAMGDFLVEAGNRGRRAPLPAMFYRQQNAKFEADIEILRKTAELVLKSRKEKPNDRKDLLNAMLKGRDPKTGQQMTDESIMDNLITFLIAGHETTSGTLSFAFYELLKHPESYQKAQKEVDEVIGTGPITVDHLSKLPYISAILRETLRLDSPIPAISFAAREPIMLGGRYAVKPGQSIVALLKSMHRDPVVFGQDADQFRPERMLDANFEKLQKDFPNCWKPFGNGIRACIGRPFAWQEALLCMALLIQKFNFVMDDPQYSLRIKQTLTIKPDEFYIRAIPRHGMSATELEHSLLAGAPMTRKETSSSAVPTSEANAMPKKPMSIFYGSNSGTCEALAQRLATDAHSHGFQAEVDALDSANEKVPKDRPVVIVTASYEGAPPDNAAHFVTWMKSLHGKEMEGLDYAVFGCGHHDWVQTFHRIPKLVDEKLGELGGTRIAPIGLSDAAQGDMFTDFETWEDKVFWPAMEKKFGGVAESNAGKAGDATSLDFSVEVTTPRTHALRQDVREALVIEARTLTTPDVPLKKHIEIQLPSDMSYSAGDYLAVLPLNPRESVKRAMRRFQLAWDAHLVIKSSGPTLLPTNTSVAAADILGAYVELDQPATKRNVHALMQATEDEATKKALAHLASDEGYAKDISEKRTSALDLLEKYPSIAIPLASFISMLPPMRVRQYSISSSPLWKPHNVTLTYAVLDAPSLSSPSSRRHIGVASNYLASLSAGDKLHVVVRPSSAAFGLPSDSENTPIMLVAAGTGLAPFRGFIQERAAQIAAGRALAKCVLWIGARHPDKDALYPQELAQWEKMGAVVVRRAWSQAPELSEGHGHIQDRLLADSDLVSELWKAGAKVYVCGSREVGEGVKATALKIRIASLAKEKGVQCSEDEAQEWFNEIRNSRYATDVFT